MVTVYLSPKDSLLFQDATDANYDFDDTLTILTGEGKAQRVIAQFTRQNIVGYCVQQGVQTNG